MREDTHFRDYELGEIINFSNGKSIKPGGTGRYPAYGSNGKIGGSDEYQHFNCIIIGRVGAYCGSIAYEKGRFWASDNTIVAKPLNEHLDTTYAYYLLIIRDLNRCAGGAAQPLLTQTNIKRVSVKLPPLPVQYRIASILSAYDDLIENNTRRIAILEEMTRKIYTEWFVHFRFPGHEQIKMVDSELGLIPSGWEVKTLGELIRIRKGQNITRKTILEGSVPVVAGGLTPAYYHNASNTREPAITISASGANAGFIRLYQVDVWASDCSVIDRDTTPSVYYYYLHLNHRQTEVTRLQRGSAQPHVYPKDIMQLVSVEPPDGLVKMFDKEIGTFFQMIKNLKMKNINLSQTRDLLLPKLISGEIDVSELQEAAAAA